VDGLAGDVEPTTRAKYQYFTGRFIVPEFGAQELGSLCFEEIEAWNQAIPGQDQRGAARTPGRWPTAPGRC
jgi:hypothetical protein